MAGGLAYSLPFYVREICYIPLLEALRVDNTQLGQFMAVFGVVSMICYFPGGWLADRISSRKLLTISMMSTGISGLYYATFPSFEITMCIYIFWGVSVTLFFWAAIIKAVRDWAPATEQGKAFGIFGSGGGIAVGVCSTVALLVFAKLGSGRFALSVIIVAFSVIDILIGLIIWFIMDDSTGQASKIEKVGKKVGLREIITVLKMPVVWLIGIIILAAYSAKWGSVYFTPYATEVFKQSVTFGGTLALIKMWIAPLICFPAGFLGDKIGSAKVVVWSFIILIICYGACILMPGNPSWVLILVINATAVAVAVFALRGVYYALLEEGRIPLAFTGIVIGIVSVIGYTPDMFAPPIAGALLDSFPGDLGYRYLFMFMVCLCILGLLAALIFLWKFSQWKKAKEIKT